MFPDLAAAPGGPVAKDGGGADPAKTLAVIRARPGTADVIGQPQSVVTVAGGTGAIQVRLYQGPSGAEAFAMISGHWFNGPDQVVVPTHFPATTGHRVGDTITLVDQGVRVPVRIVGEDFDPGNAGLVINTDIATLTTAQPGLRPDFYLAAGGVAIALCCALLPAGWTAGARTATALRTE